MEATILRHPKLTVQVRTGSEGPRHDPYAFTETTAITPRGTVTLHKGLGSWIEINGKEWDCPFRLDTPVANAWFRSLWMVYVGYTVEQIKRMHRKLKNRCRHCGGNQFYSDTGYPGEHFEVCCNCNHIHDTYFNRSEVE